MQRQREQWQTIANFLRFILFSVDTASPVMLYIVPRFSFFRRFCISSWRNERSKRENSFNERSVIKTNGLWFLPFFLSFFFSFFYFSSFFFLTKRHSREDKPIIRAEWFLLRKWTTEIRLCLLLVIKFLRRNEDKDSAECLDDKIWNANERQWSGYF